MKELLEKSWFIFIVGIGLGLFYPEFSTFLEPYLTFGLILLMTFSLKDISMKEAFEKSNIKKPFILFSMSILTSVVIIISSILLIRNENYLQGMIVMAAMPCAISVIPYTKLLQGDLKNTIRSVFITYGFFLVLTPFIIWAFFQELVNPVNIFLKTLYFVIIPLIISRPLNKLNHKIKKFDTVILNILFFILVYTSIGINSSTIVGNLLSLRSVLLVLTIRTFIVFGLLYVYSRDNLSKFDKSKVILFGYKNLGYALVLSLLLFSKESAIPVTIGILFENVSFVLLDKFLVK